MDTTHIANSPKVAFKLMHSNCCIQYFASKMLHSNVASKMLHPYCCIQGLYSDYPCYKVAQYSGGKTNFKFFWNEPTELFVWAYFRKLSNLLGQQSIARPGNRDSHYRDLGCIHNVASIILCFSKCRIHNVASIILCFSKCCIHNILLFKMLHPKCCIHNVASIILCFSKCCIHNFVLFKMLHP